MTTENLILNKDIDTSLNRIIEFRKQILSAGYDSLFSHGNVNEKRRISDHMTLCVMVDDLCEAVEGVRA